MIRCLEQSKILDCYKTCKMTDMEKFQQTIADLESGKVRVAEKVNGEWKVNSWVKEVILSGFRLGKLTDMTQGQFSFFDKDTIPARKFTAQWF